MWELDFISKVVVISGVFCGIGCVIVFNFVFCGCFILGICIGD